MSVSYARLLQLVGQAEKEGITLAELLTRDLSSEELDSAQEELVLDLANNYSDIEEFMNGVEVPSLDEIMSSERDDEVEQVS
jgi:dsDNA-binding SOS-regulon protein